MTKQKVKLKQMPNTFKGSVADLTKLELDTSKNNKSVIEVMRIGAWSHPVFGEINVTMDRLERFANNFEKGLRKAIAVDVEHKSDEGAVGWFKRLFIEGDSLLAEIEWTDEGMGLIDTKKYRFFSPEFMTVWEDPATGLEYRDVLMGGAITNRPFFRELEEVILSESEVNSLKFLEGGAETTMTKAEYLEKLKEDAEFALAEDATDEEKAAFEEAQAELKADGGEKKEDGDEKGEEGEDKGEKADDDAKGKDEDGEGKGDGEGDDAPAGEEGGEPTKASEKGKTVKLSENQFKKMQASMKAGTQAMNEIRSMKIKEEVSGMTYSEANKGGTLLPKTAEKVHAFALRLNNKQRKMFFAIMGDLPKLNLFAEMGGNVEMTMSEDGKSGSELLHARTVRLMSEAGKDTSGKGEKFHEEYREFAYKAEAALKEEGVEL